MVRFIFKPLSHASVSDVMSADVRLATTKFCDFNDQRNNLSINGTDYNVTKSYEVNGKNTALETGRFISMTKLDNISLGYVALNMHYEKRK